MKCEADSGSPVEVVLRWIIEGQTDGDILESAKQLWPELNPEDIYEQAVTKVSDASKVTPSIIIGWCFMARRELYRKMYEIGDFNGALRATEKIETLVKYLNDPR